MRLIDLGGRRFGKLTVIARAAQNGETPWICRCDCGNEHVVASGNLRSGDVGSCGRCPRREAVRKDGLVLLPLTLSLTAIVDEEDADLAAFNWSAVGPKEGPWYAANASLGRLHRVVARRAGILIGDLEVDHEDRDRLNCRRDNLREANDDQNAQNNQRKPGASGFRGVRWYPHASKWGATVSASRKRHFLGLFVRIEDAVAARAAAAKKLHGEFASDPPA